MATAEKLQKPVILSLKAGTFKIQHPDVSNYPKARLTDKFINTGTTLTVDDNNGFADNDFLLLGELGNAKTEEIDVNGAVTRGTSMTITNTTKFDHEIDEPATLIYERAIQIFGAATDGGAGTLIESIDSITTPIADGFSIQWNRPYTEYTLEDGDTTYAYYFVKFTDGTTTSDASDYIPAAGWGNQVAISLIESALNNVNASVDGELITYDWLVSVANDWQDEFTRYVNQRGIPVDWSFELFEDKTSIAATENENEYALSGLSVTLKYGDSNRGVQNIKFGNKILKYLDNFTFDTLMQDRKRTDVATAASAGETSLVVDDSSEFSDSGSLYVGSQVLTYTANDRSTNTFSGIPASGTGSITSSISVDDPVWQNISPGFPRFYTIFDGNIILDVPIDDDYVNYKIKVKGIKEVDRLTTMSSTTAIPFTYTAKDYIGAKIEGKKGNSNEEQRLMARFRDLLEKEAQKDPLPTFDQVEYYTFEYTGDNYYQDSVRDNSGPLIF